MPFICVRVRLKILFCEIGFYLKSFDCENGSFSNFGFRLIQWDFDKCVKSNYGFSISISLEYCSSAFITLPLCIKRLVLRRAFILSVPFLGPCVHI